MQTRILRPVVGLMSVMVLAGCTASSENAPREPVAIETPAPTPTPDAPLPASGDADQDRDHDQNKDRDDTTGSTPATSTTAETIAQMRALSPERRAAAHGHQGDHRTEREHPNGVVPQRLVIPAIGVDADVIELGIEENGEMEVPADFAQAGWFRPGPPPGRVGPAVIAGHVDSTTGPAVFFRLEDLEPGDLIEVYGEGSDPVVFAVRETERHAKDAFPTDKVYSGTPGPELRLITCDGEFDADERSYRDNLIVYAERVEV